MQLPGDFRIMSDDDQYRSTRPMGRPFDGSVPRYAGRPGFPDPASNPYPNPHYPSGPTRQPVPGRVVRAPAGPITPPPPPYAPEPFISQVETAKSTKKIAADIRQIKWLVLLIFISALVLVVTDLFIAARISSIITYGQF